MPKGISWRATDAWPQRRQRAWSGCRAYTAAYGSKDPAKLSKFLTRRMCQWQAESVNSYLDARLMELARKAQVPREAFAALTDGLHCH